MCGFTGYLDGQADYGHDAVIRAMADQIRHRGPDDESYFTAAEAGYAVGFRRLSIIDLEGGRQPMANEDGNLWLVFNGEIYNYRPLREELTAAGHRFATQSDSEVLLHGYEQWGEAMFERLRGMFAFVIFDRRTGELFGARDFFGIKPLYYAVMDGAFMFASEIKALLEHPKFDKRLNQRALESYLSFQYSPGPETFFEGVFKLTPGHWFRWRPGLAAPETGRYWLPRFEADDGPSLDDWVDAIERVVDDSVEAHKIADVEVGSFLSSGVDSSYIACSAHVDKTFTVGFDNGPLYNETDYARELSALIGVKNFAKLITAEEFWDAYPRVQWHMDEPLADASAIALYFVSREAAKHLKVVLSGEGADEIFGGYVIYHEPFDVAWYERVPLPIRRLAGWLAGLLPPVRGLNFLVRRSRPLEERFIGNANIFTVAERRRLLKRPAGAPSPAAVVKPWYDLTAGQDAVTRMQFVDLNAWMVGDILLKSDKMSMANSLELRPPFLDKAVMAVAGRVPTRFRVNDENTKYAMRLAAGRRLPDKWSTKKKLGFPVPIRVWLREPRWAQLVLAAFESPAAAEFFDTAELRRLLRRHVEGKADNSRKIWTVYTFLTWHSVYFGADRVTAPPLAVVV
ncbi:MAG: asparagine synthase (glutamine-hydrolyzing) [Propionibacteriaceae bacterium]|jgi:asparagine synthase (glutamine-hydrolysing)|nr:asparagine synthase (glutamine-hydrolyzing) [Propionibacteriaceae bacterium]